MVTLAWIVPWILSAVVVQDSPHDLPDDEKLRREIERLRRELAETRRLLETRTVELIEVKLAEARRKGDAAEELRLIRDEALTSSFPAVIALGVREAGALPKDRLADIVGALGKIAREGLPEVAVRAVDGLSKLDGGAPLIIAARAHFDPAVRVAVAVALPRLAGPGRLDTIEMFLRDADAAVRASAADAAAALNDAALAPALLARLAFEADVDVKVKLMDTLGALRHADAVAEMTRALDDASPRIVWTAINNLGRIGRADVVPRLERFLGPRHPQNIRRVAAETIGRLKTADGRRRLLDILDRDDDALVREAAATALALDDGVDFARIVQAYRRESTASVKQALWRGLLVRSEARPVLRLDLLDTMIAADAWAEADEVCRTVHGRKIEGDDLARWRRLERRIADKFRVAESKEELSVARGHLENLLASAEPDIETVEQAYDCVRKLGSLAEAVALSKKAFEACGAERPVRWAVADVWMKGLDAQGDPYLVAETAYDLLRGKPPADCQNRWTAAYKAAVDAIRTRIAVDDAAARREAAARAKVLGKRIAVPLLAWWADDGMAPYRAELLEIGNAVAGTTFDAATSPDVALDAWKKWAEANP